MKLAVLTVVLLMVVLLSNHALGGKKKNNNSEQGGDNDSEDDGQNENHDDDDEQDDDDDDEEEEGKKNKKNKNSNKDDDEDENGKQKKNKKNKNSNKDDEDDDEEGKKSKRNKKCRKGRRKGKTRTTNRKKNNRIQKGMEGWKRKRKGKKTQEQEEGTTMCRCSGDPHCYSYDGKKVNYQGSCQYIMTQDGCENGTSIGPYTFRIDVDMWRRGDITSRVSWVKSVIIKYESSTITMHQQLRTQFNGVPINTYPAHPADGIEVIKRSEWAIVQLDNGVTIEWNGYSKAKVHVPDSMQRQLCGLCGDFNHDPDNDWIMGDNELCDDPKLVAGQLTTKARDFGFSWLSAYDNDENCQDECGGNQVEPACPPDKRQKAFDHCNTTMMTGARFEACLSAITAEALHELLDDCIYDTCLCKDITNEFLCTQAETIVTKCHDDYGITIESWRDSDFCPPDCDADMEYDSCGSVCQPSCLDPSGEDCVGATGCVEGCFCTGDKVYDGGACIDPNECGCFMDGILYKIDDVFTTRNCSHVCNCTVEGAVCVTNDCDPNSICSVVNGSPTCVCDRGYEGDGQSCTDIKECSEDKDNCDQNARCDNTQGSFTCICNYGFTGNGIQCIDINECDSIPCPRNEECTNTDGSYSCDCPEGFEMNEWNCVEICQTGFEHNEFGICVDVPECSDGGHNCDKDATCENTEGSYSCTCNQGFTGTGTECNDVNECDIGLDSCNEYATCVNIIGGYKCTCDDGYTGNGISCQAIECEDDAGNKYNIGEQFVKDDCSETCTCESGQTLSCVSNNCAPNAKCEDKQCVCPSGFTGDGKTCTPTSAYCMCQGDPHCKTFDHKHYSFMGTCTYTLVQDGCQNGIAGSGGTFRVITDMWNRENGVYRISWVKAAEVQIFDPAITISLLQNMEVKINNATPSHFPVIPATGIKIRKAPTIVIVNFGEVEIRWKKDFIKVTVPDEMSGQVCGLCGNYNLDINDDMIMGNGRSNCIGLSDNSTGKLAPDGDTFGGSWLYSFDNDEYCGKDCSTNVEPECTQANIDAATEQCGVLNNITGPFADCLAVCDIAPVNQLVEDCVFDTCIAGDPNNDYTCGRASELVEWCRVFYGVKIDPWRTADFCPLPCPDGMTYQACGPVCQPSCLDPEGNDCTGTDECIEGCFCDQGMIQDGGSCMDPEDCGCVMNGYIYSVGDETLIDGCTQHCICEDGETTMTCTANQCSKDAKCDNNKCVCKDGFTGDGYTCIPERALCRCQGDPHYHTFDGYSYPFMGTCTYLMAQDGCLNGLDSSNKTTFRVFVNQWNRNNGSRLSWAKEVYIDVFGVEDLNRISLLENNVVQIDDVVINTPATPAAGVRIKTVTKDESKVTIVKLPGDIDIRWSIQGLVRVNIPGRLSGEVCGMCGNFNTDQADDMIMGDGAKLCGTSDLVAGELAKDGDQLGRSWMTKLDDDQLCNMDCTDNNTEPVCTNEATQAAVKHCSELINPIGPFKICLDVCSWDIVNQMFHDCVFDTCSAGDPTNDYPCTSAEELVSWCRTNYTVSLDSWRSDTFCPLNCPAGMSYKSWGPVCQPSCVDPDGSECGDTDYEEGCFCDEGFPFNETTCMTADQCGCIYNGTPYYPGDVWVATDCSKTCTCAENKEMQCSDYGCDQNAECQAVDGNRQCVCSNGFTGDGTTCVHDHWMP